MKKQLPRPLSPATATTVFVLLTSAHASEPDYRTTVDFLIKHGTGIYSGEKVTVSEMDHCNLRFRKTNFRTKRKDGFSLSWTVDFDQPIKTLSFDIPFDGVLTERLVEQGKLPNRFHFHISEDKHMMEHIEYHAKPDGAEIVSKGIHSQIVGRPLQKGLRASAPSKYMYWMIPGHKEEVRRKFEPLRRALANLVSLCGGVEETDFGVFGDNTERVETE